MTTERGRIAFPRVELPNWLSNIMWSALKVCTYKQHLHRLCNIFIHLFVFHIHVTIIIKEKGIDLWKFNNNQEKKKLDFKDGKWGWHLLLYCWPHFGFMKRQDSLMAASQFSFPSLCPEFLDKPVPLGYHLSSGVALKLIFIFMCVCVCTCVSVICMWIYGCLSTCMCMQMLEKKSGIFLYISLPCPFKTGFLTEPEACHFS